MAAKADVCVNDVVSAVQGGTAGEFFRNLWEQYQDEIINLGRCILLSILVIQIGRAHV